MFMFLPFAATRDLKGIRQVRLVRKSEVRLVRKILYATIYMWNLKHTTN